MFYHQMVQNWTGLPVAISEEEADRLDKATLALAKYYKIDLEELGVWGAWIKFGAAVGAVYGPRVLIIAAYRKQMMQQRRAEAATPVYPAAANAPQSSYAEATAAAMAGAAEVPPSPQSPLGGDPMAVDGLQRAS